MGKEEASTTTRTSPGNRQPFYERIWFRVLVIVLILALLTIGAFSINFSTNMSYVKVSVLSGSPEGNYHAIVAALAEDARKRGGNVRNIATQGSLDNVQKLKSGAGSCAAAFGLVQAGLPWGQGSGLKLIARLPSPEAVFILGKHADQVRGFSDLRGRRIGVGPKGSGTAFLAGQLFQFRGLDSLGVRLEHHSIAGQLQALKRGNLDFGFFVIADDAAIIDRAVRRDGLQIASFAHAEAIARRLPYLSAGRVSAGFYDPVRDLPPQDKKILRVDTLLVGNGCASRSETVGMLTLLGHHFGSFINYNRTRPNTSGLEQSSYARDFFSNEGPSLLDEYAPWLVDLVPIGSLVQLVMVVSILFNVMGAGNRFRLWRVDANRVSLENRLALFFGPRVLFSEIGRLATSSDHQSEEKRNEITQLIEDFEALKQRCRKYSVSMLVPMGQEMSYRYQESLVQERLDALRTYRGRLQGG